MATACNDVPRLSPCPALCCSASPPEGGQDPCEGIVCGDGLSCFQGSCFAPVPGAGLSCDGGCPDGFQCYEGTCFPVCPDVVNCDPESPCYTGACPTDLACEGVVCNEGQSCHGGTCFPHCDSEVSWDPGHPCYTGDCPADEACEGIMCRAGQSCHRGSCFDDADDPCEGTVCPTDHFCHRGTCFSDPSPGFIRGTVMGAGFPLAGAQVRVADEPNGSLTNPHGSFSVRASVGQVLRISHIGYKPVCVPITEVYMIIHLVPMQLTGLAGQALWLRLDDTSAKGLTSGCAGGPTHG
jgi:hypothetical protein